MKIKFLNDIDLNIDEGKLLFMAIARLTSLVDTDKTPDALNVIKRGTQII